MAGAVVGCSAPRRSPLRVQQEDRPASSDVLTSYTSSPRRRKRAKAIRQGTNRVPAYRSRPGHRSCRRAGLLRRPPRRARCVPDRYDAARRVYRSEQGGRGRGLAGRPLPVRLEPRGQEPGLLLDRCRLGHSRPVGSSPHGREVAAPLRYRRFGLMAPGREPGLRPDHVLPPRSLDRSPEPGRPAARGLEAGVRAPRSASR